MGPMTSTGTASRAMTTTTAITEITATKSTTTTTMKKTGIDTDSVYHGGGFILPLFFEKILLT